jgi:hypothetical protein
MPEYGRLKQPKRALCSMADREFHSPCGKGRARSALKLTFEIDFHSVIGGPMEDYIHRENLALFKKRLAETCGESERKVLAKLLAEEESKDTLPGRPKP